VLACGQKHPTVSQKKSNTAHLRTALPFREPHGTPNFRFESDSLAASLHQKGRVSPTRPTISQNETARSGKRPIKSHYGQQGPDKYGTKLETLIQGGGIRGQACASPTESANEASTDANAASCNAADWDDVGILAESPLVWRALRHRKQARTPPFSGPIYRGRRFPNPPSLSRHPKAPK
jgi:hypothetical protein